MARRPSTKPRKRASQDRSRATVAALVQATARILVRDGFDKASTNRIAETAGVSVGSLYQYFPSKEALVVAVAERHNHDIMQVVGGVLKELDSLPVEEAVRRLVEVAVEAHRVDPKLHRVLTEQIPRAGRLGNVELVHRKAYDLFSSYLESRLDELDLTDPHIVAFVCATAIEALAHNAVLHHAEISSRDSVDALIGEATRLILGYLRPATQLSRRRGASVPVNG